MARDIHMLAISCGITFFSFFPQTEEKFEAQFVRL